MKADEIEGYRQALTAGTLSERRTALAALTLCGRLRDAELCEALLEAREMPRQAETAKELDALAGALGLALARVQPPAGARILLHIIKTDGRNEAGADPLGWVWAAQTLMEAFPAHALVMLRDAVLSGVRLPREAPQALSRTQRRSGEPIKKGRAHAGD